MVLNNLIRGILFLRSAMQMLRYHINRYYRKKFGLVHTCTCRIFYVIFCKQPTQSTLLYVLDQHWACEGKSTSDHNTFVMRWNTGSIQISTLRTMTQLNIGKMLAKYDWGPIITPIQASSIVLLLINTDPKLITCIDFF